MSFAIAAINNSIVDGDRAASIGGYVLDSTTGQRLRDVVPDVLMVTDDDGPTLTLAIATDVVGEGLNPATTATLTRNAGTNAALIVTLASSDTSEATAPPTVTHSCRLVLDHASPSPARRMASPMETRR